MLFSYLIEHNRYLNFFGIAFILLIAYVFSTNKKKIDYRLVVTALIMQFVIGVIALKTWIGATALYYVSSLVEQLYLFAGKGIEFLFGPLGVNMAPWGVVFAIQILPIIVFFGALMSLLFHLGIVQYLVAGINFVVRPLLGTSGAETLCAVANSFLGQTEAPLLVQHYLKDMTRSELFVVMVSGMATISGSILAVYSKLGVPTASMLAASAMAIPASILIAKIMIPETEQTKTGGDTPIVLERKTKNIFDAISAGTSDGLSLALNVGAMLIVFISLIGMLDAILLYFSVGVNAFCSLVHLDWQMPLLNLKMIFAILFRPFAYLLGFSGVTAVKVAELLGTKVSINEFVAFLEMVPMNLSARAETIVTYALCGFANFSCIGIQIGGIGVLVPEKRQWLTELGLKTVLASSLANLSSAMIASLLI
ncbi:NupC/NupG family nucleoside CNT transporter [bacterium]|jgi:concentrative nucleoside transporter, CNT family|nr:NupC/NupG family nucleoside CNT transporter [bacterium]MBT5014800.1 NupC/NupG family nucleoside CNT transporter [bacterium]